VRWWEWNERDEDEYEDASDPSCSMASLSREARGVVSSELLARARRQREQASPSSSTDPPPSSPPLLRVPPPVVPHPLCNLDLDPAAAMEDEVERRRPSSSPGTAFEKAFRKAASGLPSKSGATAALGHPGRPGGKELGAKGSPTLAPTMALAATKSWPAGLDSDDSD